MRLFDTHAHLMDERFDADREEMLESIRQRGVEAVLECATDRNYIPKAAALAKQYDFVYCALGVHPHSADEYDDAVEKSIREYAAQEEKMLAVGRSGWIITMTSVRGRCSARCWQSSFALPGSSVCPSACIPENPRRICWIFSLRKIAVAA